MRRRLTTVLDQLEKDDLDHVHIANALSGELCENDIQIVSVAKTLGCGNY